MKLFIVDLSTPHAMRNLRVILPAVQAEAFERGGRYLIAPAGADIDLLRWVDTLEEIPDEIARAIDGCAEAGDRELVVESHFDAPLASRVTVAIEPKVRPPSERPRDHLSVVRD